MDINNIYVCTSRFISYTSKSPNITYYGVVKEKIKKDYIFCELRETNRYKVNWSIPKRDTYIKKRYNIEINQWIETTTFSEPLTQIFHISRCKLYRFHNN